MIQNMIKRFFIPTLGAFLAIAGAFLHNNIVSWTGLGVFGVSAIFLLIDEISS